MESAVAEATLDKDQALREDIRLLGRLLGDTLREQEGAARFELVEAIRLSALAFRRDGDVAARAALEELLDQLGHDTAISVVRAFSFFSQLANIAEDLHHNRRRRAHLMAGSPLQEGSFALALARLQGAGIDKEALQTFLSRALISPVLTAHPTEVQRKSILDRQLETAELLNRRDRVALTPEEERDNDESLRRTILTLWQTRITRSARLSVYDEIENGLAYYHYTFLRELPKLYAEIEDRLDEQFGGLHVDPLLKIGNWIGGDRDGNPNVTAEVTRHALQRQSELALDFFLSEVHTLGSELSQARRLTKVSSSLEELASRSPDKSAHREDEPYRRALTGVYARLATTARGFGHGHVARAAHGRLTGSLFS